MVARAAWLGSSAVVDVSGPSIVSVPARVEDADGFDGTWFLIAYAVCVPATPDIQVVKSSSVPETTPVPVQSASVACPAGMVVTDAAGEATNGRSVLILRPSTNGVDVIANSVTPTEGIVFAYAVCSR